MSGYARAAATIQGNAFWIFPLKSTLIVFSFVVLHRGWNTRPGLFYIQLLYSANSDRLFGGTVTVGRYSDWNIPHELAEFLFHRFCNMGLTSKKKENIASAPHTQNITSVHFLFSFRLCRSCSKINRWPHGNNHRRRYCIINSDVPPRPAAKAWN